MEGWVPEPVKGFCSQTLSDSTDRIRASGGYAHPFGFSQLLGEGREHWLLQARGGWIQRGSFLGPSRAETDCRLQTAPSCSKARALASGPEKSLSW